MKLKVFYRKNSMIRYVARMGGKLQILCCGCCIYMLPCTDALGQIYECNSLQHDKGKEPKSIVFTNKECTNGKEVLKEIDTKPPSPEEIQKRTVQRLLSTLDNERFRLNNEFGINVNIDSIRELCNSSDSISCEKAVNDKDKEIRELYIQQKNLKASKPKENDTVTPKSGSDSPVITIIQNRVIEQNNIQLNNNSYNNRNVTVHPDPRRREPEKRSQEDDILKPYRDIIKNR